jgi:hypothetical protein
MSGGSGKSKTVPQSTPDQWMSMYNANLPRTMAAVSKQVGPLTKSMADAAANTNPTYTASGLIQLNTYAPGYQQAGSNLSQAQALSNADLLSGGGGLFALMGAGLTNLLNPAQAAANTGATNLVNSINLNGLSGGEQAAVERSLNQSNIATGNMGLDNATNAVRNAMMFGQALADKRTQMGNALNTAINVAQAQNTAFSPVNNAMAAGNTSNNFGLSTFNPTQGNSVLTAPFQAATGWGNQLAGIAAAPRTTQSSWNAGCCFIFLESFNGTLPWWVRVCRDEYYQKEPIVATGYKRMAKWLVPLMKRYNIIRRLVNKFMVIPITKYGGYMKGVKGHELHGKYKSYKTFWFMVWRMIGAI